MDAASPRYPERVYAGILGKLAGVYFGRPVEGWSHEDIVRRFGEITTYVSDQLGHPVVVPDDDISGTLTFIRALADNGYDPGISPAQVGETWLNYIIEQRAILWWGGHGNSTEHTAFLNLQAGVPAPESGSIARNGQVTAEQIGAQIFIDSWGIIAPGDPQRAADLARRAASVSHDGAAIHAAQVVAAMVAQAFVEPDPAALLDVAVSQIPADSTIASVITRVRDWCATDDDWLTTRQRIADAYPNERYPGNVHVVPNHAVIVLALLHGGGDFRRSLSIATTAGWDTDCNAGNVGCILATAQGLAVFDDALDLRQPINDRLYLPTADGGRAITDAVIETGALVRTARALSGGEPWAPKGGARFHFDMPGATQGFTASTATEASLANVRSSNGSGSHALRIELQHAGPVAVMTPTFLRPEETENMGYAMLASPTLYAGQMLRGRVRLISDAEASARIVIRSYDDPDALVTATGPSEALHQDAPADLSWTCAPDTGGPIASVGLEISGDAGTVVELDFLTWDGVPDAALPPPSSAGKVVTLAWVNGVDQLQGRTLSQNRGTGLISQGTREWTDYRATATVETQFTGRFGIAARVQGMRRWYALLIGADGHARLIRAHDGTDRELA
ncbi:MAG: ADP-ribosylglycohydrolase family protein, partial [Chloroflexia bacterium]|nr:ADP-ribosylglycohydrolase family protein [Chloroflexia bacterium]